MKKKPIFQGKIFFFIMIFFSFFIKGFELISRVKFYLPYIKYQINYTLNFFKLKVDQNSNF